MVTRSAKSMAQAKFLKTAESIGMKEEAIRLISEAKKRIQRFNEKTAQGRILGGQVSVGGLRINTQHEPVMRELIKRIGVGAAKNIYMQTRSEASLKKYDQNQHQKLLERELVIQMKRKIYEKQMPKEPGFDKFSGFMTNPRSKAFLASRQVTINKTRSPTDILFAVKKGKTYIKVPARTFMDLEEGRASAVFSVKTKKGVKNIAGLDNVIRFLENAPADEF